METMTDPKPPARRSYPAVYERVVPIAIGVILVLIAVLLLIVAGVVLKVLPGSAALARAW